MKQNYIALRLIHILITFIISCLSFLGTAQEKKNITIVYGGNFTKNEIKYPGASIFSKDNRQVQFEHQGVDLWCDVAIYNQKENRIKAFGNVRFNQGDTIQMQSGYLDYDGNTRLAYARDNVKLNNLQMELATDTLYFDRNKQDAYYNSFGTVKDSINVLTSEKGHYYLEQKRYQFLSDVKITNPDYVLNSLQLDYYTITKHAYMYGPSTITGKDYKVYCERGFYDTSDENGYFIKNSRIDYNNRIIYGDSLYFDKIKDFASATNNIKVIDTINKGIVKGHYAEVYKQKDSVFITKRAVAINLIEKDSMYIHGDTLMVTGKPDNRIIRGFRNVKFYKKNLSGKCDSIHVNQKTGLTQLIGEPLGFNAETMSIAEKKKKSPILWSGKNQMTGDSIHLITNIETEKLDSLKVLNNAFIIEKDTLSEGFNQVKGKNLFGLFVENQLDIIDVIKNTEVIYYMYNDENELIGIDKTICSAINMTMTDNQIEDITFFTNPDGDIFPEKDLPVNARKLSGFVWRGDEMISSKEDIFDEDDNNIQLVKIRGIDNPIDIDAEEYEKQSKNEPPNEKNTSQKPNSKGTSPNRKIKPENK
ncbi:OstA-like protein [Leptobacterium meishanense]|uniref:OstA-like protein n=1 Tax=Leptobacterium meishanense TaxID=3128904 RepID=UPI0039B72B78